MVFHEFDARAVRIVQIRLPLVIPAGFYLDGPRVILPGRLRVELRDGGIHIRHLQRQMVAGSALLDGRHGTQHELDVLRAFRHHQIGVARRLAVGRAAPELPKAERLLVKGRGLRFRDVEADMQQSPGNALLRHVFAHVLHGGTVRLILGDVDMVPVRVIHHIAQVADSPVLQRTRRCLHAFRKQILPESVGIVGFNGQVHEARVGLAVLRRKLHVLTVVDLDEGHPQFAVLHDGERLAEAQQILVEVPRSFDVVDVQGNMRHTHDAGTRIFLRGGHRAEQKEARSQGSE